MSSNHKAPLAAFMVVAIACVVVLATNSMRSYARDAWRTFAAPVVSGLQLVETHHPAHSAPRQPTAPVVTTSQAATESDATVVAHHAHRPAHAVRPAHAGGPTRAIAAVKSPQPQDPGAAPQGVTTSAPTSSGWPSGGDDHVAQDPFAAMAQQVLAQHDNAQHDNAQHDNGQHTGWSSDTGSHQSASDWFSHAGGHVDDHHGYPAWGGATSSGPGRSGSAHDDWSNTALALAASISTEGYAHGQDAGPHGHGNTYGHGGSNGYGSSNGYGNAYGHSSSSGYGGYNGYGGYAGVSHPSAYGHGGPAGFGYGHSGR